MQVTDRNSEQVLRGVQRLRSMASCGDFPTSLSLAIATSGTSEAYPASIASTALARLINSKPSALELLPLRPSPSLNNSPSSKFNPVSSVTGDLKLWRPTDEYLMRNNSSSPNHLDINHMPSSSESADLLDGEDRAPTLELSTCIPGLKRHREKSVHTDVERGCNEVSSRTSDEEEAGSGTRKKLRLTKEQSALLEESFKKHSTLNPKQKSALAKQLNLRPRQVEVWFQNRRARTKLKKTEVDCEVLKRCCESLTEENRRLQKEVAELRALKVGAPCVISHDFYKPLPATTLTMCPSCERLAPHSSTTTTSTVVTAAAASPSATTSSPTTTTTSANKLPFPKPHMSLTFSPQQQSSAAC